MHSFHKHEPLSHEIGSEWVSEQMSPAERASSAEHENEWASERPSGKWLTTLCVDIISFLPNVGRSIGRTDPHVDLTRPYTRQNQTCAIGQEQWRENCSKNAEKTNALPTNRPTDRPTDTVGYSINKTICIIEFNQAVIQFPCKCVVASVVLGCNKNIITKEKIGLWVFWTNLYIWVFPGGNTGH